MDAINCTDPDNPHSEGTVTVNSVLLEISVHFILNLVKSLILCEP